MLPGTHPKQIRSARAVSFISNVPNHFCVLWMQYLRIWREEDPGFLFLLQSWVPLTQSLLTSWLRHILAGAGIPGTFSSHSFRIGAATVAAQRGIPDHVIQMIGKWISNTYQRLALTATCLTSSGMHVCHKRRGVRYLYTVGVSGSMLFLPWPLRFSGTGSDWWWTVVGSPYLPPRCI